MKNNNKIKINSNPLSHPQTHSLTLSFSLPPSPLLGVSKGAEDRPYPALQHQRQVVVSVPNNQILTISSSNLTVAIRVNHNVASYYPGTLISVVAVDDEFLTTTNTVAPPSL